VCFTKTRRLRFLSHLDMVKTWQVLVERAALPVAYSRGFHPVALLQYAPPLPVGYAAQGEWLDLFLRARLEPDEIARRLEAASPDDMRVFAPIEVDLRAPAPDRAVLAADYEVRLSDAVVRAAGLTQDRIEQKWREACARLRSDNVQGGGGHPIESIEVNADGDTMNLRMRVGKREGNLPQPLRLLGDLLGREIRPGDDAEVVRLGLVAARWVPPPPAPVRNRPRRNGSRRRRSRR
jgi:radical SAM-linked protein